MSERLRRKHERDYLLRRANNEDPKVMNLSKLKQLARMPRYTDEQIGKLFRELEKAGTL